MSFSPISYLQPLAIPLPPVDVRNNINNYLVEQSFCDNWTEESLVHFPVRRPAADSISAGDHYFKWHIKGRSLPLCTVTFSILPFVDAENPICYCNNMYYICVSKIISDKMEVLVVTVRVVRPAYYLEFQRISGRGCGRDFSIKGGTKVLKKIYKSGCVATVALISYIEESGFYLFWEVTWNCIM